MEYWGGKIQVLPAERTIAALLTVHNRKDLTILCLERLFSAKLPEGWRLSAILVDDGSRDGTSEAVNQRFPEVQVIPGDGSLYWNGGMRRAFSEASRRQFGAILFLNDDTLLDQWALEDLLSVHKLHPFSLVVGAICDPQTGDWTYGGAIRSQPRLKPFKIRSVEPSGVPQMVDVANGNVLLIPSEVAAVLGNLDGCFTHGMGDTDYSLRAKTAGIPMFTSTTYVGKCARNSIRDTYKDPSISIWRRYMHAFSIKGVPVGPWFHFCRRHGGSLWALHFLWPYVRIAVRRK